MMYPLVRELAAKDAPLRVPVAVTCRVLNLARQPYYRWLVNPVTHAELTAAYRANALFDAHRDDPEFGYRFLVDEAREAGTPMAERTAWKICSELGWWSARGKKHGRNGKKAGPPVHEDLVERDFTADAPNQLGLADITEHWTREGKLYLCAIKDVYSNRIVGSSIDSRMKSRLAVAALENAVARRRADSAEVAGCVLHSDRGSQFRSRKFVQALNRHAQPGCAARHTRRSRSGYSRRSPPRPPAIRPDVMLSSTQNTSNTGEIPTPLPAACGSPATGTAFTRATPALST
jgi:transposase InsO family protein